MKYIATITPTGSPIGSGNTLEIEVEEGNLVRVDGEELRTDLEKIGSLDLYSLLLNDRSFEVHVRQTERNSFRVMISGQGYEGYEVEIFDERLYRLGESSGELSAGTVDSAIKAPIPGLVVKVLVEEGEQVEAGQSLVILEAMKMENELRAPRNGTVATILIHPGDSVDQGEALVTLH
ncbi:MAG: biotin/lipoyl-containing protein [Chloroflexota bacterium]|nr:biotin/lipoyl-containing protein [Chloroflexota bacterium]